MGLYGLRPGDRLVTVNEVMVVFLPVFDVMKALNMDKLVANIEFERPTYRGEFQRRDLVRTQANTREAVVMDMITDKFSVRSERNTSRTILDKVSLADKRVIHEMVRQDKGGLKQAERKPVEKKEKEEKAKKKKKKKKKK